MTGDELICLIVSRLREIPKDGHYEMIASYGLAHEFLHALMCNGISVVCHKDVWYVNSDAHNTFFPVRIRSNLQPGIFILQPRGGDKKMAKKKAKKPKQPPGGGY